jgi:hypothetical protein
MTTFGKTTFGKNANHDHISHDANPNHDHIFGKTSTTSKHHGVVCGAVGVSAI